MQNKPLFTIDEFISLEIELFTNRVNTYLQWKKELSIDEDINYKYIYIYDEASELIDFYKVKYFEPDPYDTYKVKVVLIPPQHINKTPPISDYYGNAYYKKNTIIFNVENDNDVLMILFNKTLKSASLQELYHNNLYGIAIGIDDYTKNIPKAKKVIFRKNKISDDDLVRTYFILNEMEILTANENKYNYETEFQLDIKHLEQYKNKISYIDTFFTKLRKSKNTNISLYHSLAFKEFHATYQIFKKIVQKRDYYVQDRKRVFSEFLDSVIIHNASSCYMVLPAFIKKSNVFLYDNIDKKQTIKEKIFNLIKSKIQVNIIFVINSADDCIEYDFHAVLQELQHMQLDIRFVFKKMIENQFNSFDFFFDDGQDDLIITKEHKVNYKVFDISRQTKNIKNHKINYNTIKKQSISYDELLNHQYNMHADPILDKLIGTWFYYAYGSYKENGLLKLWKTSLNIDKNYHVFESINSKQIIKKGSIKIENSQCLITLVELETRDHSYISFDSANIQPVFIAMRYTKQHPRRHGYMVMIGLFSKEALSDEKAKELLGSPDDLILKISPSIQNRIDTFVVENYSYYKS